MGSEAAATFSSVVIVVLLILACVFALQNAESIHFFEIHETVSSQKNNAILQAEKLYEAATIADVKPLVFSSSILEGGNQNQEVSDSRGLIKISSFGNANGCYYTVEFPKLGIPSLDHHYYKSPQEQGGRMGISDCGYDGAISLGRKIIKHLKAHMNWLGKSYRVQRYVFALIVEALEELLGDNAIMWGVQSFEFLENFK